LGKKKMDVERAVVYVQSQGDAVERAHQVAILWDEPPPEAVLRELASLQKPDGGFAHWVPGVSNVCDTAFILQWFDDLKVYRGRVVDSACRFLLDHQQEDGGWDEVGPVRALNPPEWMMPSRTETRVWLTAFCAHVLIRFGTWKKIIVPGFDINEIHT
jgi:hypothetical protein